VNREPGCRLSMRNVEAFIIAYASFIFSTVFGLSLLRNEAIGIDVYAALFVVEFFIASELTSPFTQREHQRKAVITIVLLFVLAGVVVQRIIQILH